MFLVNMVCACVCGLRDNTTETRVKKTNYSVPIPAGWYLLQMPRKHLYIYNACVSPTSRDVICEQTSTEYLGYTTLKTAY